MLTYLKPPVTSQTHGFLHPEDGFIHINQTKFPKLPKKCGDSKMMVPYFLPGNNQADNPCLLVLHELHV